MSAHAILGASSAARWIACPGSIKLIDTIPVALRDKSSRAAAEGTAAHQVAEWCLRNPGKGPDDYPETHILTKDWPQEAFPVDAEMCEAVFVYLDKIGDELTRLGPSAELRIEQSVKPFNDRDDMWGTADAVIIQPWGELQVWDYKHGKGVLVSPKYNSQAMFYALGVLESLGPLANDVTKVTLGIVQPRTMVGEGVKTWETTVAKLREFGDTLRQAADLTKTDGAPLMAGDHCKFCPAKGICPRQRGDALALLDIPPDDVTSLSPPPVPHDPGEIARLLTIIPRWDEFVRAVEGVAMRMAENGAKLPGYKLVRKKANRRWRDTSTLESALTKLAPGIDTAALYTEPDLRSPAQIEKVLTKMKIKPAQRREIMEKVAIKPEGGMTLTADDDPRDAIAVTPSIDLLPEEIF
jgi:hypothetical protein